MTDGIINIDTKPAKRLEFTSDKFNPASYLWKTGDTIVISFIMAKQKSAFSQLLKNITAMSLYFEIPTPSSRMKEIGEKISEVMEYGLTAREEEPQNIVSFKVINL
jgi:hypothetical protein